MTKDAGLPWSGSILLVFFITNLLKLARVHSALSGQLILIKLKINTPSLVMLVEKSGTSNDLEA